MNKELKKNKKNITLLEYLQAKFGKDQVVVKKWPKSPESKQKQDHEKT